MKPKAGSLKRSAGNSDKDGKKKRRYKLPTSGMKSRISLNISQTLKR